MPDTTLHNHGSAMAHTFDESLLSDLHEAAYGYRPREWFWSQWCGCSDDDKQVVWDNLCRQRELNVLAAAHDDALACWFI